MNIMQHTFLNSASAAGELELANGNHKTARKLLRLSLEAPTDNAVAQAQYIAQFDNTVRVAPHLLCDPAVCEGRYWKALSGENWERAYDEALEWHADEPYSRRPAINASFIASSFLNKYQESETIAREGLQTDPKDQLLRNNLVVALAHQGRLEDALAELRLIQAPLQANYPKHVFLATQGLVSILSKQREFGRAFYKAAIDCAPSSERERVAIHWFQAESLADPVGAAAILPQFGDSWDRLATPLHKALGRQILSAHQLRMELRTQVGNFQQRGDHPLVLFDPKRG